MKSIGLCMAGAVLGLAGCLTVEKAKMPGDGGHHVMVRNYGKFLFNCVPMGCGNVNVDPKCNFVIFRNDVTMDKMQHRFFLECAKLGSETSDITYHTYDNVFLEIPLWSFNIPIPYVWTTREIQITGVVK